MVKRDLMDRLGVFPQLYTPGQPLPRLCAHKASLSQIFRTPGGELASLNGASQVTLAPLLGRLTLEGHLTNSPQSSQTLKSLFCSWNSAALPIVRLRYFAFAPLL
jgi:hypothetical protein